MSSDQALLLPLKLDAFVLNEAVCDSEPKASRIAPLTQPNYSFLRLEDYVVQNDILDHVDIRNATPTDRNSRLTDLGRRELHQKRLGVYLHWMIPRPYRNATVSTEPKPDDQAQTAASDSKPDPAAPKFPEAPNRWMIIRKLDPNAATTKPSGTGIEDVKVWIIESDRVSNIDELDNSVDLQTDVSPFITSFLRDNQTAQQIEIGEQAEIFIGHKQDAHNWTEDKAKQFERVRLSMLNSSNQLFPDYQPHCSNVFSLIDTFDYGPDGAKHLLGAKADYHVLGWHSDPKDELLYQKEPSEPRSVLLERLNMQLNRQDPVPQDVLDWLGVRKTTLSLCHGTMYGVDWQRESKPSNNPADEASIRLNSDMPLSVGATPTDALLTYVDAHHTDGEATGDLYCLQRLLRAQDESIEAQLASEDDVHSYNFAHFGGGCFYHFAETSEPAKPPGDTSALTLRKLNATQELFDSISRLVKQMRWDLFACWWNFVSDYDNRNGKNTQQYVERSEAISSGLESLLNQQTNLAEQANGYKADLQNYGLSLIAAVHPEFQQHRDPTLFVAGVKAGWPFDFLDPLVVRLQSQVMKTAPRDPKFDSKYCIHCLPHDLQDAGNMLVHEFLGLAPEQPPLQESGFSLQNSEFPPLYHDRKEVHCESSPDGPWRDRWEQTQAWFPLFLEWEVEYTHIPYENWDLDFRTARQSPKEKTRFALTTDVTAEPQTDQRRFSGRTLLLPQPSFSLSAQVKRLFSTVSKDILDKLVKPERQKKLFQDLEKLPFVSTTLNGFTDHLMTMAQGVHIKPNVREPGKEVIPLDDARDFVSRGGLNLKLELVGKESEVTPYGKMVDLIGHPNQAFKPVTHGQFIFTKLNVIDKFGQVAHAIDPQIRSSLSPPVYPYISEFYEPQLLPSGQPNVVHPSIQEGYCECVQVPPQINQPARLNATFVVPELDAGRLGVEKKSYWRPSTQWENPVWGWLVVNYVNNGIQLFLPNGTFYREYRLTRSNGAHKSPLVERWLPFPPPKDGTANPQLDRLITKFNDDTSYAHAFVEMINKALAKGTSTPASYAQQLNCMIGRPLALVNMGWSIELAENQRENQSTLKGQKVIPPEQILLPDKKNPDTPIYQFPLKFGDPTGLDDGLIGYCNTFEHPQPGDEVDLTTFYSHFGHQEPPATDPIQRIDSKSYPKLKASWVNPLDFKPKIETESIRYAIEKNRKYIVFGALVDPFHPISCFTSILPKRSLRLPPWTSEEALKKMTSFFHAGPIIIEQDVPKFEASKELRPLYPLDLARNQEDNDKHKLDIPALAVADWKWLQPYNVEGARKYNDFELKKPDSMPSLAGAPYTAVEGYIQMTKSILQEKPV